MNKFFMAYVYFGIAKNTIDFVKSDAWSQWSVFDFA